ncbi:MAG TPA: DMT family transporter [Acidobacteriaceae bacterium]|nr:DMT family transporter [Acidobacteriaceae bacterium]
MNSPLSQFEAVGLALAGYTCWVFADTSIKIVGASNLPAYEVIGFVGLSVVTLLVVQGVWRRNLRTLWPKDSRRQLLRSCLDLANNLCVVIALRHLPLPVFYILIFLAPSVTTLLAALFLDEPLEWKKALAILTGLAGVGIAVDPFGSSRAGDWTGYLACMVCVVCFSANMVWSRVMTQTEAPESLTFFSGLMMAVVGFGAMARNAEPVPAKLAVVLAATGLFCVLGSICFFVALKHTSSANVAQYHYSQLVTGSLIAYLVWDERLTSAMLLGAALIIGAGCYTAAISYGAGQKTPSYDLASPAE